MRSRGSDINVIVKARSCSSSRSKNILFFPRNIPLHTLFSPSTSCRESLVSLLSFPCHMAALEQPVDLGARSDTLEEVRCSQSGSTSCSAHVILRFIDIQTG